MITATCHCGAVRLEIARRPRTLTACNCSICRRYAALWAYGTTKTVRVQCRTADVQTYQYDNKTFLYHRCATCGCVTHYTRVNVARDDRLAVNARMIDPDTIAHVPVKTLDVQSNT